MSNGAEPLLQLLTGFVLGGLTLYSLSRSAPLPLPPPPSPPPAKEPPLGSSPPLRLAAARASPVKVKSADELPSWASKQPIVPVDDFLEAPSWVASSSVHEASSRNGVSSSPGQNGNHHHHREVAENGISGHAHVAAAEFEDEVLAHPSWMSENPSFVQNFEAEDDLPSWMSRTVVPTPIKPVRATSAAHSASHKHATALGTANHALSVVAHHRSDAVFVYPVLDKGFLGEGIAKAERVHVCETRVGAGRVVVGMAEKGTSCSVLTSSLSLSGMSGALLAMKDLPVVVHVAAMASDDELALRTDYTDCLAVRDFGLIMLVSCDAQEASDLAVIAHEIARLLRRPVMHILDGARVLNRHTAILAAPHNKHLEGLPEHPSLGSILHHSHTLFAHKTDYAPFEFSGSHDADVVCVSMGPSSKVIEHAAQSSSRLASVRVRLLDPWLGEELCQLFPRSLRRICVLDESADKALFGLVAKAVFSCSRLSVSLTCVNVAPTGRGLTLRMADSMFDEVAAGERAPAEVYLTAANSFSLRTGKHAEGKTVCWFVPPHSAAHLEAGAVAATEALKAHHSPLAVSKVVDPLLGDHGCAMVELRVGASPPWAVDVGEADVVAAYADCTADATLALKDGGVYVVLGNGEVSPVVRRRLLLKGARAVRAESEDAFAQVLAVLQEADAALVHAALPLVAQQARKAHAHLEAHALNDRLALLHRSLVTPLPPAPQHVGKRGSVASVWNGDGDSASVYSAGGDSGAAADDVFGLIPRLFHGTDMHDAEQALVHAVPHHAVAWSLLFRKAFNTGTALRPREHDTYQVRLTVNKRLTPKEYERNIFHLEFDISGTGLTYQIGDALGVFGHNDEAEVDYFMREYNVTGGSIDPTSFVGFSLPDGRNELVSARNLLIQHLDLFGKPNKKFYLWLSGFAKSRYEHLKLLHTGTDDTEAFKLNAGETVTYADILLQHPSARPSLAELAQVVPAIKARHYSIASSMKLTPMSVHLLVVEVDWKTPSGRTRHGQCTRYLSRLDPSKGDVFVTVDVMPSVLRLPPDPRQPVLMAGLGTGMAPFRAFAQERKFQKEAGMAVGPMVLYFGARHRHEEWLYGEEWDQYAKEGLVELRLAFSRDQKDKVYIQHKIQQDAVLLKRYLGELGGFFYLCGPTWPVPDVTNAVAAGVDERFKVTGDTSSVDRLKEEGRFILEVY